MTDAPKYVRCPKARWCVRDHNHPAGCWGPARAVYACMVRAAIRGVDEIEKATQSPETKP